jgi:hypothetical protein
MPLPDYAARRDEAYRIASERVTELHALAAQALRMSFRLYNLGMSPVFFGAPVDLGPGHSTVVRVTAPEPNKEWASWAAMVARGAAEVPFPVHQGVIVFTMCAMTADGEAPEDHLFSVAFDRQQTIVLAVESVLRADGSYGPPPTKDGGDSFDCFVLSPEQVHAFFSDDAAVGPFREAHRLFFGGAR